MMDVSKSDVAVLIPTYMPGEYLRRCLNSLSLQTLSKHRFCVYIALNGPAFPYKESVLGLLDDCSFNYKFYCIEEPGVSRARNFLIDISREPYVCFLDDDDVLSESYLEDLLSASDENSMAISNVLSFANEICDAKPNYIGFCYNRLSQFEVSKFKARKYFSSPCAKMMHRDIVRLARFDKNLSKGEDALFMATLSPGIKMIKKANPEACYYVYERPGSATRKRINRLVECKRVAYLSVQYGKLLFEGGYEKKFILTRIAATLLQLRSVFK